MGKWILRIGGGLLALLVLAIAVTVIRFEIWKGGIERALAAGSMLIDTAKGPVEYAELGQGPAVLMLHGAPGGYDDLYNALKLTHVETEGFQYIVPSRPGYLRTPLSVGRTPAEQADAMAALLDALHIGRAAIVGQSGGGPVALQFALRHPDRCAALVLESALVRNYAGPPPVMPPPGLGSYLRDLMLFLFKDSGIAGYQAQNPDDPEITVLAQAAVRAVVPLSLRRAGVENDLKQQTHIDGWPLERIACPTLILQGTTDESAPAADAEFAHRQIPNSELIEYPGQDHMLAIVKHKEVATEIGKFIRAHQP
jgi:pimeloyl-ACP methyl ester carboxylesterase